MTWAEMAAMMETGGRPWKKMRYKPDFDHPELFFKSESRAIGLLCFSFTQSPEDESK